MFSEYKVTQEELDSRVDVTSISYCCSLLLSEVSFSLKQKIPVLENIAFRGSEHLEDFALAVFRIKNNSQLSKDSGLNLLIHTLFREEVLPLAVTYILFLHKMKEHSQFKAGYKRAVSLLQEFLNIFGYNQDNSRELSNLVISRFADETSGYQILSNFIAPDQVKSAIELLLTPPESMQVKQSVIVHSNLNISVSNTSSSRDYKTGLDEIDTKPVEKQSNKVATAISNFMSRFSFRRHRASATT